MSEILSEALSRLDTMRHDHGQTWDLSKNDEAAISAVLDSHAALRAALDKATAALVEIAGHTCTRECNNEGCDNQRIAAAAIARIGKDDNTETAKAGKE